MFLYVIVLVLVAIVFLFMGFKLAEFLLKEKYIFNKEELDELIRREREDAIKRSRAVIGGQFSEQLAPYLPDFPFKPTEAKFLGKPIDFIVFKGLDNKEVKEVVFVEVKSGKSNLSGVEKTLKKTIENKKISYYKYNIPEKITK